MVLAEMCSEVDGSNKITFPCALPECMLVSSCACDPRRRILLTESDVAVLHPRRDLYLLV